MDNLSTLQDMAPRLRQFGDATAVLSLTDGEVHAHSFAMLADDIERLASGLLAQGLDRGETVALYADGSPEWVIAFLAVVTAGAVAMPLDVALEGEALAHPLRDSDCRRVFTTARHASKPAACDAAVAPALYLLDDAPLDDGGSGTHWRRIMAGGAAPRPSVRSDDQAALFYTSGTTGPPKGVPLSHGNLVANINALVAERTIRPLDRVLLPLPPHHVYPLVVGVLAPLASGAAVIFPAGISGPRIVGGLRSGEATILIGVPRLYTALLGAIEAGLRERGGMAGRAVRGIRALIAALPDGLRRPAGGIFFRRLRAQFGAKLWLLVSGGAHLDEATWRAFETFGWTVLTGYGLTETAPILTFNTRGAPKVGSAGKALAGVQLRIADEGGRGFGEIEATGPNVFAGYRNRPRETAEAFTPDGWFRTGDLGTLDGDGHLHIVGRSKELIVLPDGKNVFPEDVEKVYGASPLIEEIGVLERDGVLAALIVPDIEGLRSRGAESVAQLIRDEIRDRSPRLAPYQRLSRHLLIRRNLPRTTIGKLRRHLLPELYDRAARGDVRPAAEITQEDERFLSRRLASQVWEWLKQRFPANDLSLDTSPQMDLGIDSLGWTGLSLEIENRFDIGLADDRIARIVTLRDLIREMEDAAAAPAPARTLTAEELKTLAPLNWLQRPLNEALYGIAHLAIGALLRLRVAGLENLPPSGPYIIAPNHASWLDPPVVAAALPYRILRNVCFGGWTGLLFDTPLSRGFSRIARVFPVNPDRAAGSSLALARAVLERGDILVWFPEGRRTRDGALLPFQPGIGALAAGTDIPVVPVLIAGTFEAAPSGTRLARLVRVSVRFGPPLTAQILAARGEGETAQQKIASGLRAAVAALREPMADNGEEALSP